MAELNKMLDSETAAAEVQEQTGGYGKRPLLSLKNMLVAFIALCWGIPVLVIFVSFYNMNQENAVERTQGLMKNNAVNSAVLLAERINRYISDSKRISYQMEVENTWRSYERGYIARDSLRKEITRLIDKSFQHNMDYEMAFFQMAGDTEQIPYVGGSRYPAAVREEVERFEASGSFAAYPVIIEGRLFIIRNMYTVSSFRHYGILVLEINTARLTKDIGSSKFMSKLIYSFGEGTAIMGKGLSQEELEELPQNLINTAGAADFTKVQIIEAQEEGYEAYAIHRKENSYILHTVLLGETNTLYADFKIMKLLILCVLLVLIPVILFAFYFIKRHVTSPIDTLVKASRKIRGGDIDTQIDGSRRTMPNREFAFLMVSFNKMAAKIKYLLDYAYNEQLARKDAQIMALQSQINPHFLNNTLEMMNWQARMSGDIAVSKMIEALSTLMSYSMDRSNARVISLAEEIRCADAYLYIISMRFGQRLLVEKEIDESLLQTRVPGLILQPLLENAVVHGVEKSRNGKIWLKVFCSGNCLLLQVLNTGNELTQEDEERIEALLQGGEPEQKQGRHTSLGIRNVNERIKLIYGREYGLMIQKGEKNVTQATITIPYEER